MDEIIPSVGAMPSCSQAGGAGYIEQLMSHDAKVRTDILDALSALESFCQNHIGTKFQALAADRKAKALTDFERQEAQSFRLLRDVIYEAYYEQQEVWKLINYEFFPTNNLGPALEPFDDQVLAEARKRPRGYREVEI
jgi:Gluconate 2-dehydrogenase subunit 3